MVLSAILSLNSAGFTTGIGKAIEGIRFATSMIKGLGNNDITKAFDLGGSLSDLSAQLSEPVGSLMVLKQAFQDTGVGAEALGPRLNIMRKALAGIDEDGKPTAKMFQQLGLSVDGIKGMSAKDQLGAIGGAIRGLASPAEQTAAAMAIFGRSGGNMLGLFKDPAALEAAAKSLGGLPALMDRNAAAFDAVSDRIGRIKEKGKGLWAGIAEGLLPLADSLTTMLDGIDLTAIGRKIGAFLGTTVELFRTAPLGQVVKDLLVIGFGEALNWIATGFMKLGGLLWEALSTPLSYLSAGFTKVIQEIIALIGKIPGVGKALGIDGFKAESFDAIRQNAKAVYMEFADYGKNNKLTLVDTDEEKARLAEAWSGAADAYAAKLDAIQKAAKPAAGAAAGYLAAPEGKDKDGKAPAIQGDQLARIGGFVGGVQSKLESLSERTAKATEQIARLMAVPGNNRLVWGGV